MCGRTRCTLRVEDLGRACGFSGSLRAVDSDRFRPSYNVSPGRYMPVVRHVRAEGNSSEDSLEPVVHCMKWGLVPSFSKTTDKPDHFRMFNARSESVRIKSSFRRLLPKNRCLTAVEGFYEWKKDGAKKQPYYVHFKDGRPLVFAGLYDSWKDEEGNILYTFYNLDNTVFKVARLASWMPVILSNQGAINSWLNDDPQESLLHKLSLPYEKTDLVWYPVTPTMGKPTFDSPECIKEIKPKLASDSKIAQLFGKTNTENLANKKSKDHSQQSEEDAGLLEQVVNPSLSEEQSKDLRPEYDRKCLLAGMETEHDLPSSLMKGPEKTEGMVDPQNYDPQGPKSSEVLTEPALKEGEKRRDARKGLEFNKRAFESCPMSGGGKDLQVSKGNARQGRQGL